MVIEGAGADKLRKKDWRVETIPLSDAQALVRSFHYTGSCSNTAVYRHGLINREDDLLYGTAMWLPPTGPAAKFVFPEGDWRRVLSLSRLAIVPSVPSNAASFLIGASIRLIREDGRFDCLVTYADSSQEHTGAIYKATNWEYMGTTAKQPKWVNKEGQSVARKATKTRTDKEMRDLGHEMVGKFTKERFRMVLRSEGGS